MNELLHIIQTNYIMKKIIIIMLAIVTIFACAKETTTTAETTNTQTETTEVASRQESVTIEQPVNNNGMLIFRNEEHFTQVMTNLERTNNDEWENSLGFTSIRRANPAIYQGGDLADMPIQDKYLPTVLNNHYMVQVGNWIFKLQTSNRTVYALFHTKTDKIDLLRANEVAEDSEIRTFSFDDEVFETLAKIEARGVIGANSRNSCASSNSNNPMNRDSWTVMCTSPQNASLFESQEKFQAVLKYDGWGIYKCLYIRWCHKHRADKRPSATSYVDEDDQGSNITFIYTYKKKNSSNSSFSTSPQALSSIGNGSLNFSSQYYRYPNNDEQWNIYRGTTCLETFNINAMVHWNQSCPEMNAYPNSASFYSTHTWNLGTITN
jgi:hypothetical protein